MRGRAPTAGDLIIRKMQPTKRVCVVGAGVIGLSTALRVYERCPGTTVTVIAEEFTPNTTGDGAGGFWQPFMMGDTPEDILRKWGKETFEHLLHLTKDFTADESGTFFVSGYDIYHKPVQDPFWKDLVLGFRHMTKEELAIYPGHEFGYQYTTLMAEGRKYLPWLTKRLQEKGCTFIRRKVAGFDEVIDADVIVNCTGLGARELAGDSNVQPMKGLLIRAKAPWIKFFLCADHEDLHVLLGRDAVVLGGTHILGDGSLDVNDHQRRRILEGCYKLIPSLKNAEIVEEWVGLRPSRPTVRLELEIKKGGKKIVHNYGHGGGGITFHWGCANQAADLVKSALNLPSIDRSKI